MEPRLDFWGRLFFLKRQTVKDPVTQQKVMTACGAAMIHICKGTGFEKLPLHESVKGWQ